MYIFTYFIVFFFRCYFQFFLAHGHIQFIWPIYGTLTCLTTPIQSGLGSNSNERVLLIPRSLELSLPIRLSLLSYPKHSFLERGCLAACWGYSQHILTLTNRVILNPYFQGRQVNFEIAVTKPFLPPYAKFNDYQYLLRDELAHRFSTVIVLCTCASGHAYLRSVVTASSLLWIVISRLFFFYGVELIGKSKVCRKMSSWHF